MLKSRIEQLTNQLSETTDIYEKEDLKERIAKLSGGIGIIKVCAATDMETINKKYKIEDAINATQVAMK
jgi:chaperonin GroEL